ncbi:MAG: hydrogenase [Desulfobacula sp.]|jgi:hydrogenase-4 component B|uniref:proton-conducting transporter transmembrane domain-containing protein n=2 Tax=Desulfobacula sp. TaxID=2593537 RepID=UPI001D28CFBB|nr:hydrogenase [Desulfobacula sp.]MBT3485902.1 hydrogenase [Desulfobacula sp.]MBT3805453.1 hydrogenase [Desulfobacula sp.]MBT4025978.1 hydrogenase [Desulfobacula sp.]MBT4199103.1 hydrogenase [Desulfobacula sp.]
MGQFFVSILLILLGGLFSLFLVRQAKLSRIITVFLLSIGCFWGLLDAVTNLMQSGSIAHSFNYLNIFSLAFQIDGLSGFFLVAIFTVSLLAAIYSFHYMDNSKNAVRTAVNYFFFSILIASMAMVVTAANIITFMLSWEIMSLSSFFLVIYKHHEPESRKAGYLYFVFSHVGAMFIFAAFAIVYGNTGSFGFEGMGSLPETAKILVFIFSFIGFGSKAGIFPFHVWLPHAHPAAPSHISAVMSGVMIKTGIYGILRMYALLNLHTPLFGNIVLIAGVISGILGIVYALGQQDLKRLLAYSSVENIGIILIGLGIGMIGVSSGNPLMAVLGFTGGFLHILNHSIFKTLLFMGAGMVLHKTGTRSIDALGGLLKNMKITGAAVIIGSLAICGIPPFNGFVGEFFIYIGGFKGVALENWVFVMSILGIVSLAIIGGLALACFTKVIGIAFQGEPRTKAAFNVDEKGPTMILSMSILAFACVLIGLFPKIIIWMPIKAVSALGLGYGRVPLEPFEQMTGNISLAAAVFIIVLLLVIAIRSFLYKGKKITKSGTWGCGFTQPTVKMQYTGSSYASFILDFFRPAAPLEEDHPKIAGRFPLNTYYKSHVNDLAELHMKKAVVNPVLFLFDKLRWIQHGDIHLYIGYILLAIILLLFFI